MTILAWDGKTFAADRRSTVAGLPTTTRKVFRIVANMIFAGCGDRYEVQLMADWLTAGGHATDKPTIVDSAGLIIKASTIRTMEHGDKTSFKVMVIESKLCPVELVEPFVAMGSGRDYALATMHLGHSAHEAVAIASKFDTACGNGVTTATFKMGHWSIQDYHE
jgi:hypothetical protein